MDQALIAQARAGDQRAYSRIVELYLRRIYRAAYAVVKNMEDAADIAQETFIRAFRRLDAYDPRRPFYPWIYRIARNLSINHVTRRRSEQSIGDEFMLEAAEPDPESTVIRGETSDEVRAAVAALPKIYAEIIELQHFQECSYAEIAAILEIPIGTVMSRLYHARRKLREALVNDGS